MDRRHLITGAAAASVVAVSGLSDRLAGLPAGRIRDGWQSTPDELRMGAAALKHTDMTKGGGRKLSDARGMAHNAVKLLDAHPTQARAEATAWLVANVGFMSLDMGKWKESAYFHGVAFSAVQLAGNHSLEARILGQMARQALWQELPLEASNLVECALELPGLTGREQAMLWALEARAQALLDEPDGVRAATDTADNLLDLGGDIEDRPWVAHYDWAHQHGDIGGANKELALRHGHRTVTEATGRQGLAITGQKSPRSRAMTTVSQATLDVTAGDFEHGLESGHRAVDAADGMRSWRLSRNFEHLVLALRPHMSKPAARELRDRVVTM